MLYDKLKAGTVKKHSEQLNKWVAGFLDADGSISLHIKKHSNGRYGVCLQLSISQINTDILVLLQQHFKVGDVGKDSWHISGKQSHKFIGLLRKHLLIKATHLDNLLWVVEELKGVSIQDVEDIREYSKCSRLNSRWDHKPKHIPYAWMAGYLDGDGHYRVRLNRVRRYSNGSTAITNELKLFVGSAKWDSFILDKLKEDHGGTTRLRKDGCYFWQLSLGKNSRSKALSLLRKLRKYSCLPYKREAIDKMITFHTTCRD